MAMHYQGFEVAIYEKVHKFMRLGDSLGLGENALRLLKRWGLYDRLIEIGNKSEMMQIRRWHDGKILAQQPLMDMAGYIGHRGVFETSKGTGNSHKYGLQCEWDRRRFENYMLRKCR
jgi:salicylate hydroxylase